MAGAFPRIFTLGQRYIEKIFDNEVEVTEKVDGSQFGFGKIDGELYIRSKGKKQHIDCPDKMFQAGIEYVQSIEALLPEDIMFYGEYLRKPKHNCLCYDNFPKNHVALFGVRLKDGSFISDHDTLTKYASDLGVDVVPLIFKGKINNAEEVKALLKTKSYLGGVDVEGVVIKNYEQDLVVGGHITPIMCGKYVSEAFKEVHQRDWKKDNTGKGKFETFKETFKSKARWLKAIQYLRDNGELTESPRDIGKLMKQVNIDITAEEKENIKDFLWKEFGKDVLKTAVRGLPEFYKEYLLTNSFEDK